MSQHAGSVYNCAKEDRASRYNPSMVPAPEITSLSLSDLPAPEDFSVR